MRPIGIALLALLLGSCAVGSRGDPEIFRVGELEVWLYRDQEKMARDLPTLLTLVNATKVGDKQIKILGYYDKTNKRIYSIDDARILLHEFKHYFEPDWRHGIGAPNLEEAQHDGNEKEKRDSDSKLSEAFIKSAR